MKLKNYILIVLISVGTYLVIGYLTDSQLYSLLAAVVMALINIKDVLIKYLKSEIDEESEQKKENRKTHTSDLKAMIQTWQRLLFISPIEEITNTNDFDDSFIKNIEFLDCFEDFFYHCPDVKTDWNEFKFLSQKYKSRKHKLFNLIKEKINQKLGQNINIESDVETGLKCGFQISVYRACVIETKRKDSKCVYDFNKMSSNGIEKTQVYCFQGDEKGRHLTETCLIATTNEPDKIKEIHTEIIKECLAQYIDKSKEIIGMESKLWTDKNTLNLSLKKICKKPFDRMNCEFVIGGN